VTCHRHGTTGVHMCTDGVTPGWVIMMIMDMDQWHSMTKFDKSWATMAMQCTESISFKVNDQACL
jgi:hypothetical protein